MTTFEFMRDLEAMALYSRTECIMTRMPIGCGWLIKFKNKDNELTDAVKDFCLCNAFKYLYRHKRKNGLEDIKKAKWYIDKYLELSEENK